MPENCDHNSSFVYIDCDEWKKFPETIYFPRFEGKYEMVAREMEGMDLDNVTTTFLCPKCGEGVEV